MSREVIAVDLDDVVVSTAESVIEHYGVTYGVQVSLDDYYQPNYEEVWQTADKETAIRRVNGYLTTDDYHNVPPSEETAQTIGRLGDEYELVIVTGRPDFTEEATRKWLERYFPSVFQDVIFSNHFDLGGTRRHKGDICRELGATILIDDHLGHALNAAESDVKVLLYGQYPWNAADELPENITRVMGWQEIGGLLLPNEVSG